MAENIKRIYIPVAIGLLVLPIALPLFILLAIPIALVGWLARKAGYLREEWNDT